MKSCREELLFDIPRRRAFVNITGSVEKILKKSGIQEGLVLVKTKNILLIIA
jgi:thiamine phosphate synthase YjbQ (UPF0047 family)